MPAHDEHDTQGFPKSSPSRTPLAGFRPAPDVGRALRRRAWIAGESAWSSRPARPVDRFPISGWGPSSLDSVPDRVTRVLRGDLHAHTPPVSLIAKRRERHEPVPRRRSRRRRAIARTIPAASGETRSVRPWAATEARAPRARRIVLDPHAARRDAATLTRAHRGAGGLATAARARLRRADACAATLLRRLAERRYGALVATALLAAMLISLSWLGLAMRDASAARGAAEQEQDRGTRGAQERPDAYRRLGRPARASFGDRAAA